MYFFFDLICLFKNKKKIFGNRKMDNIMNEKNSELCFVLFLDRCWQWSLLSIILLIFLTVTISKKNYILSKTKSMSGIFSNFLYRMKNLFQTRVTPNIDEKKTMILTNIPPNLSEDIHETINETSPHHPPTITSTITPTKQKQKQKHSALSTPQPSSNIVNQNILSTPNPLPKYPFLFLSPIYYRPTSSNPLNDSNNITPSITPSSTASLSPITFPKFHPYISTPSPFYNRNFKKITQDQATQTEEVLSLPSIYSRPLSNIYLHNGLHLFHPTQTKPQTTKSTSTLNSPLYV